MEGYDVALRQQGVQIHVGDAGDLLFCAAVGVDLAAEGLGHSGHLEADGAGAHHAELLALQLKADETVLGFAVSHGLSAGGQVPVEGHDHAEDQVGHGGVGVAGAVAHGDAPLPANIHGDVVHTGEGHGEHL